MQMQQQRIPSSRNDNDRNDNDGIAELVFRLNRGRRGGRSFASGARGAEEAVEEAEEEEEERRVVVVPGIPQQDIEALLQASFGFPLDQRVTEFKVLPKLGKRGAGREADERFPLSVLTHAPQAFQQVVLEITPKLDNENEKQNDMHLLDKKQKLKALTRKLQGDDYFQDHNDGYADGSTPHTRNASSSRERRLSYDGATPADVDIESEQEEFPQVYRDRRLSYDPAGEAEAVRGEAIGEPIDQAMDPTSSLRAKGNTMMRMTNNSLIPDAPATDDEAKVSELLNLSNMSVESMMEVFHRHAPTGRVNRETFQRCFAELLRPAESQYKDPRDWRKLTDSLNRLFSIFDKDGNGVVDAREFLAGLTVLCGGDRDTKIRAAFNLYDLDGNGTIEFAELAQYLGSVFSVIAESSPGLFRQHGVTPEELGSITAQSCFAEADQDGDGRLTFEEFRDWYSNTSGGNQTSSSQKLPSTSSATAVSQGVGIGSLEQVREISGLGLYDAQEVFEIFSPAAASGYLDWYTFLERFQIMLERKGRTIDQRRERVIRGLFEVFDQDDDQLVDIDELSAGLSVLTKGTREEKIKAAFDWFDVDGNGVLTLDEMTAYLTAVFTLLYACSPGTEEHMGVGAEELGAITAEKCFNDADTDHDGFVTLEEFLEWQGRPSIPANYNNYKATASTADRSLPRRSSSWVSLQEASRLTGLDQYAPEVVFETFANEADENGMLSRAAFSTAFHKLASPGMNGTPDPQSIEKRQFSQLVSRLFDLFDLDGNGKIDFPELSSGLSVLTGGNARHKIESVFSLYDYNGDGYIQPDEMERYLRSVYMLLWATVPEAREQMKSFTPEQLARVTTEEAFANYDRNHDGKLSLQEFTDFFLAEEPETLGNLFHEESEYNRRVSQDEIPWFSMMEVRRLFGMYNQPAHVVFEEFAREVDAEGWLPRDAFQKVVNRFAQPENAVDRSRLEIAMNLVFDEFESASKNGKADFSELMSAMSVMCGGKRYSKASAAFELFDIDGNGFVDFEEMKRYLTAVFKMVYVTTPGIENQMQCSAEDLAGVTAEEVFSVADLNHDGRLSFDEFQKYFDATDGSIAGNAVSAAVEVAGGGANNSSANSARPFDSTAVGPDRNQRIPISEVRRVTSLQDHSIEEVFNALANRATYDDQIDRTAFYDTFAELIDRRTLSAEDQDTLNVILDRLFRIFDTQRNNKVAFAELASGISVLCGGDRDQRAEVSFLLFDSDNDGRLRMEELYQYLVSIYRVVYYTEGGPRNVDAEELAYSTASQVFQEVIGDSLGAISYREFSNWVSSGTEQPDARYSNRPRDEDPRVGEPSQPPRGVNQSTAPKVTESNPLESMAFEISEVARLTNFASYEAEEIYTEFQRHANASGEIEYDTFVNVCRQISRTGPPLSPNDAQKREIVISKLFAALDKNSDGLVDSAELISGLSLLCDGSRENKVLAAFNAYDSNGDGVISLGEMISFLESVYTVTFELDPNAKQEVGNVSARELAEVTAETAFTEADQDQNGYLTYDEFKAWYKSPEPSQVATKPGHQGANSKPKRLLETSLDDTIVSAERTDESTITIQQVQRLTGISNASFQEITGALRRFSKRDGSLSWTEFCKAFSYIVEEYQGAGRRDGLPRDKQLFQVALRRLFAAIDSDHNGILDFSEVTSALNVLSRSSMRKSASDEEENAFAVFDSFDYDADGYISFAETCRYLIASFRTLFEFNPEMHSNNLEVEELAERVATQMFAEADVDDDRKISREEFVAWYRERDFEMLSVDRLPKVVTGDFSSASRETGFATSRMIRDVESDILRSYGLNGVRRLTGLNSVEPTVILETFAEASDENGGLSRTQFFDVLGSIAKALARSPGERESLRLVMGALFRAFDLNQDGVVSFDELAAGLTVLCRGNVATKARVAFDLYDLDSDGKVSFKELFMYTHAVFRLIYALQPPRNITKSAEQLALETTQTIFEEADLDQNDSLSFEEFQKYYEAKVLGISGRELIAPDELPLSSVRKAASKTRPENPIPNARGREPPPPPQPHSQPLSQPHSQPHSQPLSRPEMRARTPAWLTLPEVRRITNLQGMAAEDVLEEFAAEMEDTGHLSKEGFFEVFESLASRGPPLTAKEAEKLHTVLNILFDLFDVDDSGTVDFSELASGLSVLTGGDPKTKASLLFSLFDTNGDGYVSQDELYRYLRSVFAVVYEMQPGTKERMHGLPLEDLALMTTQDVFMEADANHDGFLSYNEFCKWIESDSGSSLFGSTSFDGGRQQQQQSLSSLPSVNRSSSSRYTQRGAMRGPSEATDTVEMEEVRRLTGLGKYTSAALMQHLLQYVPPDGEFDRASFFQAFDGIVDAESLSPGDLERLRQILYRLFDVFDADGNGGVDMSEMAAGLSILCDDSKEDKILSAFQLFDLNGDGAISLEEMETYLASVFRVMFSTAPGVAASLEGTTPEEIARATAEQAFVEADIDNNGMLSLEEFKAWFEEGGNSAGLVQAATANFSPQVNADTKSRTLEGSRARGQRASFDFGDGEDPLLLNNEVEGGRNSYSRHLVQRQRQQQQQQRQQPQQHQRSAVPMTRVPSENNNAQLVSRRSRPRRGSLGTSMPLAELRRITHLGEYDVEDALEYIMAVTGGKKELDFTSFIHAFRMLITQSGGNTSPEEENSAMEAISQMFGTFDTNHDGVVSFKELAAGLSVLCSGNRENKALAAFTLFDEDGDGFLSLDEMTTYLTSVFRVLYNSTPQVPQEMNISPEELGYRTAVQAFTEADLNHDGKLSFSEFAQWYNASPPIR